MIRARILIQEKGKSQGRVEGMLEGMLQHRQEMRVNCHRVMIHILSHAIFKTQTCVSVHL